MYQPPPILLRADTPIRRGVSPSVGVENIRWFLDGERKCCSFTTAGARTPHGAAGGETNTLDADFCVEALEEALTKRKPEIFNADQSLP